MIRKAPRRGNQSSSRQQRPRTTHEVIAPFEESQGAVRLAGKADSGRNANWASRLNRASQPERAIRRTQVDTVLRFVNSHRLGQPTGPSGKVLRARHTAIAFHDIDPFDRIEGADQNSGTHAGSFTGDIHHPARTIRKVNIRVPAREKERAVPGRLSSKGMSRGVPDGICFGLNDPAAHAAFREVVDQGFAHQVAGELDSVDGKFAPSKPPRRPPARNRREARRVRHQPERIADRHWTRFVLA
jgi:hypothetical protein